MNIGIAVKSLKHICKLNSVDPDVLVEKILFSGIMLTIRHVLM